ncbi:MAG TPA: Ig-like domain-containing protein, partial [Gemmata sp.]|nr:Ig-like domain-containing protein [Gemmata sp.]
MPATLLCLALASPAHAADGLGIFPSAVVLHGRDARQQLVVTETRAGAIVDRTAETTFSSNAPSIARVKDGVVTARGDGEATITATAAGKSARVIVRVTNTTSDPPITFERDIQPILTRLGCNAGACHGKARGQNGFALSLLAYDNDFDFNAIATEARGRRIFPANPAFSLFLRKPTGQTPHGGGKKFAEGDATYRTIEKWIA